MIVSKTYIANTREEAETVKQYFEKQGAHVDIVPIADEFRRVDDPRPWRTTYYIHVR